MQDEQLAQGRGERRLDAQDRTAYGHRGEAPLDERVDLALDPATLGADRMGNSFDVYVFGTFR